MKRSQICLKTQDAIEDIFDKTEIGTREDAINLLNDKDPKMIRHLDICNICDNTLDIHLRCETVYASID